MELTGLSVSNFKSLTNVEIKPRKITILIGPNSSGKSSVLQALATMKQSLIPAGGGYFRTKGEIIDLGEYSDVVSNHDIKKNIGISVSGKIQNYNLVQLFHGHDANIVYNCRIGADGVKLSHLHLEQNHLGFRFGVDESGSDGSFLIAKGEGTLRNTNTTGLLIGFQVHQSPGGSDREVQLLNTLLQNADIIKGLLSNYYYVPPSRTMDEYGLPLVNVSNDEIVKSKGQKDNLSRLISYISSSPPHVTDMISNWTEILFGKRIRTRTVPTYENNQQITKATIDFLEGQSYNSIINDGSGTNQVILLLTLLGMTPNDSILGIEEPEIHLHPKAQADLAKIMIDVSTRQNKQIIFTTHSEHMIYPFLTNVAKHNPESLSRYDLALYYFEKDKENGGTTVTPLEIDEFGMISGGMKGFFEAELNSLDEYLKALEK